MQYIDQTGLYVVEDMLQDLKAKGITVVLVGLLDQPRFMMERIDIIPGFIPENQIFDTFKDYLNVISKWKKPRIKLVLTWTLNIFLIVNQIRHN